jgi:hypothetical protein
MSKIEVDAIDKQSGSTLTLGGSGTAVTLACGATQTGFGRTGTVDWQTGSIKSATFTAVNGEGYFVNTTAGAVTMNLPASPSAGNIVSVSDYAKTAGTNNITVGRNGSNIDGGALDLVLNTTGVAVTLVYVDATKGWKPVNSNEISGGPKFVTASGGDSITCTGDFKIHTFTGPGTFCVSCAGNPSGSSTVDYLVVAGGGSGGGRYGGGGGGGGYRESSGAASGCYTRSPLGACVAALPVTATTFPITIGAGASGVPAVPGNDAGARGSNSIFSTITSGGGGAGAGQTNKPATVPGGSGGGGPYGPTNPDADGGVGNIPSVSPAQGQPGGRGNVPNAPYSTGGGGGATEAGVSGSNNNAGRGGAGATSCITGSPVGRSGGGGGSGEVGHTNAAGAASPCGSGTAGAASNVNSSSATANKGGGSGGAFHPGPSSNSGSGGSGIVVIRYKYK